MQTKINNFSETKKVLPRKSMKGCPCSSADRAGVSGIRNCFNFIQKVCLFS